MSNKENDSQKNSSKHPNQDRGMKLPINKEPNTQNPPPVQPKTDKKP